MSHRKEIVELSRTVIVGVDTHKHIHVAVALDAIGARLATCSASADRAGYMELVAWARALGIVEAFGIEGTGSYGVGLASFVRRHAIRVVEVSHCDRRKRRNNGKSDTIDAETPPARCCRGSRQPSRRPPTAPQRWCARSKPPEIPP